MTRLTRSVMDDWAEKDPDFAAMIGWTDNPLPFGSDFRQLWSPGPNHGRLRAGTKPPTLLASGDRGATWAEIARHLPTIPSVEVLECNRGA